MFAASAFDQHDARTASRDQWVSELRLWSRSPGKAEEEGGEVCPWATYPPIFIVLYFPEPFGKRHPG